MSVDYTPRFDLSDRIVLVTGATRGIGRACALACAGAGADVIVGVRNLDDGAALVEEFERQGRRGLAVKMDLQNLPEMREAVAKAHAGLSLPEGAGRAIGQPR
jgi:NAD(P)-dependent dehydrogenase (short-subunit alcohol dehydrogenase family)